MGRKCSHCGNIGHNSRTCNASKVVQDNNNNNIGGAAGGGVMKLFGVHIYISSSSSSSSSNSTTNSCGADNPMKKSLSLDCLSSSSSSSTRLAINDNSSLDMTASFGSLSDAPPERKKGVPWTEEEHRSFLIGLEIVGKGDWRGISRNYVPTRTPTQVASHAQKYFLRLSTLAADKKRRRSSLFDMVGAEPSKP